ncbi:catalase family protein [Massilia sp. DWR3-1-1]|uniref:catalase family protein n=1 Tax=Massilia sp. DWR3-1-1 TaxID=2804559 RepID=UPI003CF0EBEC
MTMRPAAPVTPLMYQSVFEVPEEDEAQTVADLLDSLKHISTVTYADGGHALRSVHAKSHGILRGTLTVLDGLPQPYAQGLFATPASYEAVARVSTTPGDLLDDKVSTPRGLALKLVGVAGARVEGSEQDTTQDFVMVNGPVFAAPTAKKFSGSLKLLAPTTDKVPGLKVALATVLRGAEKALEAVGGESGLLKSLGGHPATHPLGETYFTQAPVLYGPYMAKFSLVPVSPELLALTDAPVELAHTENGLRDAIVAHFASHGGQWELRVQLCTDLATMPIEDSSVEWSQQDSPYVAVARLSMAPQAGWSEALSTLVDDGMRFNPWHALAAHRPIGSIMRVRKAAYAMSSAFRFERSGVAQQEPKDLHALPR